MHKAKIVTIALTLLLSVSMLIIVLSYHKSGNNVTFDFSVHKGSLSDFEGLKFHIQPELDNIFWAGNINFTANGVTNNLKMYNSDEYIKGTKMGDSGIVPVYTELNNWEIENPEKMDRLIKEKMQDCPSVGCFEVPLSDYYPYIRFSLQGNISTGSNGDTYWEPYNCSGYSKDYYDSWESYISDSENYEKYILPMIELQNKFLSLFKVRHPKDLTMQVRYWVNETTNDIEINYTCPESTYKCYLQTDVYNNNLFIWLDSETADGYRDFSEMPGGYGIYVLPLEVDSSKDFTNNINYKFDEFQNILPLDVTANILFEETNSSYDELLIYTKEGSKYYFYVIDINTYTLKQTLEFNKDCMRIYNPQKTVCDGDYIWIWTDGTDENHSGVIIIQRDENGKYSEVFCTKKYEISQSNFNEYITAFAVKNGKLAVVNKCCGTTTGSERWITLYGQANDAHWKIYILSETQEEAYGILTGSLLDVNKGHSMYSDEYNELWDHYKFSKTFNDLTSEFFYSQSSLSWE